PEDEYGGSPHGFSPSLGSVGASGPRDSWTMVRVYWTRYFVLPERLAPGSGYAVLPRTTGSTVGVGRPRVVVRGETNRSVSANVSSVTMARSATRTAPARIFGSSPWANPSMMYRPSP